MKKRLVSITLMILLFSIISSCGLKKETNGPYFGNGFHNGWADQHSIVIWTRLTKNQEGNANRAKFIELSSKEANTLDKEANAEKIHAAQIPDGLTLEDMIGACPGTAGEVKLIYYPLTSAENKTETDWIAVDNDKNYTHQWKTGKSNT